MRWEFNIVTVFAAGKKSVEEAKRQLNELGREGWQGFGVASSPVAVQIFLQRPLPEDEQP
jgi:hypothetical protein